VQAHGLWRAFLWAGVALLGGVAAQAQTDVAVSVYGAFSGATTGNGVTESPANAAGGLLEVRHITHPWFGYEGSYAFNRANQQYSSMVLPPCPPPGGCGPIKATAAVSANAYQLTGDWVASLKIRNLRPFALAGGGLILDVPTTKLAYQTGVDVVCTSTSSACDNTTTVKPVFVYGAGLDWGLLPHLGLRFQYRGNLYKVPDLTKLYTSTDAFTHTAEPMIGVYFRL
jgi:hypothetical protein